MDSKTRTNDLKAAVMNTAAFLLFSVYILLYIYINVFITLTDNVLMITM